MATGGMSDQSDRTISYLKLLAVGGDMIDKTPNLLDDLRHRGLRCERVFGGDEVVAECDGPFGDKREIVLGQRLPVTAVNI